MEEDNVYYLIKPRKGYGYLQRDLKHYLDWVGNGIHKELPQHISSEKDPVYRVISSEGNEFWEILAQEKLFLKSRVDSQEQELDNTKNNLDILVSFLKYKK